MGIKTALKPSRAYNLSLIDTTRLRIFSTIELLQGCQVVTLKFTKISKAVKHCMNVSAKHKRQKRVNPKDERRKPQGFLQGA